jgi:CMP-N-acetylneuraminic acid synthetase|tara:strand:- start:60 stop:758 length:699 start_codon:yes stop_codon:yes gene_type:complete
MKALAEIICIIPARMGSKEIPMKNIVELNGKPLLFYSIRSAIKSKFISRTVISTDNLKIANIAKKFGAEVVKRPKRLANGKLPMEPVIEHVLETLQKKENYCPEIIVVLPNTSPLRTSVHVDKALKKFCSGNYDSLTSGFRGIKFMWKHDGKFILPLNNDPKNRPNRQDVKNQFIENGAIHITKYKSFMKNKCRLSGKIGIFEMPEHLSFEIDSIYDLKIVEFLLKNKLTSD